MAELRADKPFYDASGGGVTFSGGEPLSQEAFLEAALRACRAEGIRTAIETSSFAAPEIFMRAARQAELLLLDLKFVDERLHRLHTGVSNAPILANLRAAARAGLAYALRLPLIPGYNDAEGELKAMAELAAELLASWRAARASQAAQGLTEATVSDPAEPELHILPYHDSGAGKYALCGLAYPAAGTQAPSRGRLERVASIFEDRGLSVRIGA
jgi:pyruvate formate lyase activating enzyme